MVQPKLILKLNLGTNYTYTRYANVVELTNIQTETQYFAQVVANDSTLILNG